MTSTRGIFKGEALGQRRVAYLNRLPRFTAAELNALQLGGVISDHCVTDADVANGDRTRAKEWLEVKELTNF